MQLTDFSMDFFSLRGRNAVVTGATNGLGQAFAVALATAGANLYIPGLRDDDGSTRSAIESAGGAVELTRVDVTAPGAARAVVDGCLTTFGSIDILVNSAGVCTRADVADFGREHWDPMVAVNLTAPFELSHEAARHMTSQRSGKIINVCSLFSFLGGRGSPAYAATKHGLVGLTKAYADELAHDNVQVNAIAPGYYATDITAGTRADPHAERRVVERIPAQRWGEPLDLMGATVFLASRASDYVTGQVLVVDGGYLVR